MVSKRFSECVSNGVGDDTSTQEDDVESGNQILSNNDELVAREEVVEVVHEFVDEGDDDGEATNDNCLNDLRTVKTEKKAYIAIVNRVWNSVEKECVECSCGGAVVEDLSESGVERDTTPGREWGAGEHVFSADGEEDDANDNEQHL